MVRKYCQQKKNETKRDNQNHYLFCYIFFFFGTQKEKDDDFFELKPRKKCDILHFQAHDVQR